MSKFDFKNVSDEELLNMENTVDKKVTKAVTELMYSDQLLEMMEKLEEIKKEKRRREING